MEIDEDDLCEYCQKLNCDCITCEECGNNMPDLNQRYYYHPDNLILCQTCFKEWLNSYDREDEGLD